MSKVKLKIFWCVFTFFVAPYSMTYLLSGGQMAHKQDFEAELIEIQINGVKQEMQLEGYILGVLANEIPVEFELEAMKAQAVIVRTRLHKDIEDSKDITYGYLDSEGIMQKWQSMDIALVVKSLEAAVYETSGLVMIYDGLLIVAPYHYCNNGITVSGKEGFGTGDYPYLQSVECGMDETNSESYENHGMGLSQHTAGYMALEGKGYEEILKYFYTDIEIVKQD